MCKKIWATAKLNMRNIKVAYLITAIIIIGQVINYFSTAVVFARGGGWDMSENANISVAWMLWLLPVLSAILVSSGNFRRTINLGAKRETFFWSSLTIYALFAGIASFAGIIMDSIESRVIAELNWGILWTSANVFGWGEHGVIVNFFQQFAFLFLVSAFFHTLAGIQDKWYGWVTDVMLIAIISVFTPIAPLRAALAWFFNLILFETPLLQIPICIILAMAIYSLNKPIFARKVI
jgi:hypothetical protein